MMILIWQIWRFDEVREGLQVSLDDM
jgi:hypothetical protein